MIRENLCRLSACCAVVLGCLSTAAMAADLPIRKAPVVRPLLFTWTGFYGGVHVGYAWDAPSISSEVRAFVDPGPAAQAATIASGGSGNSALGGLQLGYNLQVGSWVYGIETDLAVTGLKATNPIITAAAGAFAGADTGFIANTSNAAASIDWFGTVRGRLGFAWDRALLYVTGGLSYGSVRLNDGVAINGFAGAAPPVGFNFVVAQRDAIVKLGWAAGVGIDYAVTNNLILSIAYLHVDLGSWSQFSKFQRPNGGGSATNVRAWALTGSDYEFDLVRVAASWKM